MGREQSPLSLTPGQLETLASSARLAIVQRLEIDGEATVKELAERMGRPVTALYHHLVRLEEFGLIRIVDRRATGHRPEAVYAPTSHRLSSALATRTPRGRKALSKVASRVVGASLRSFAVAVERLSSRLEGPQRNTAVRHLVFRATPACLERINGLIDEIEEAATSPGAAGEDVLLTIVLAPMTSKIE